MGKPTGRAGFPDHRRELCGMCCSSAMSLCDLGQACVLTASLASSSREERPGAVVIAQLSFIEHTLAGLMLDTPVTLTPRGSPWLFCVPCECLPPGPCRGVSRTRHSPALDSSVQAHGHLCMSLPPSDPMGAVCLGRACWVEQTASTEAKAQDA